MLSKTLSKHCHLSAHRVTVATILNISLALSSTGWDGAPLNRAFYPSAVLSTAAVLALLTLATRFDVCYPAVYCWAVVAIVADDTPNRGPVGLSLVSVVGSLTFFVLVRHVVLLCKEGRANFPSLVVPDPARRARRESLNATLVAGGKPGV